MGIVILLWEKSQQGSKDIHFHGAGIGINAYYCSTCSSRFLPQLCPPLECIIASGSATLMPSFSGVTEPPSLVKQHWMNWDTTRLFCTHFSSSHSIGGKVLTLLLRIAHSMVHIKNEHRWHIRLSELPREPCWYTITALWTGFSQSCLLIPGWPGTAQPRPSSGTDPSFQCSD
jgi:hypothetical protein